MVTQPPTREVFLWLDRPSPSADGFGEGRKEVKTNNMTEIPRGKPKRQETLFPRDSYHNPVKLVKRASHKAGGIVIYDKDLPDGKVTVEYVTRIYAVVYDRGLPSDNYNRPCG